MSHFIRPPASLNNNREKCKDKLGSKKRTTERKTERERDKKKKYVVKKYDDKKLGSSDQQK